MRLLPAPVAVILLAVLLLGPFLLLPRLGVDNSPETYFPVGAETVQFERELRERFPHDQVIVGMFEPPDPYSDEFLTALSDAVRALQRNPLVDRVLSPMTLDQVRASEDGFLVEPVLSERIAKGLDAGERRERMLEDRFAPGLIVSRDGGAIALIVRPKALEDSFGRAELERAFLDAVREAGIELYMTALSGIVPLEVAQLRSMVRDTVVFVPLIMALGLALTAWLFRRWLAVVTTAVATGAVAGATVGMLILAGQPYTLISAILPPLMSALTVALLIHWFNALTHAAARGLTGRERVARALREIARPALFTALTTAAGLASLMLSPIRPVGAFGAAGAAGVMLVCAVVLLLFPPLFARWDRGNWATRGGGIRRLDRAIARLRNMGMRRAPWVLAGAAITLAAALAQIPRIEVETDLFRFFGPDHPISVSTERIQDRLTGVTTLEIVLDAPHRDALTDPARLVAVRDLQDRIEALPQVDRAVSMVDLIEEMHWGFHGEDPAYRTVPDSANLISQYLLIYDGIDLHEYVDRDFRRTRIVLNLDVHGARAINAVMDAIDEEIRSNPPADLEVTIAGFGRLFGDQEALLIEGQVRGLFGALVLIFALMAAQWRSAGAAAIAMVPNMAPVVLIFGLMGVLGIWLDMATAMIASVTIGIAVDDTIHFYDGYRRRLAAGASRVQALARSYQYAGRAVIATTIILAGQFAILGASQFVPTVEFGLLTAFGLVAALVFDLLVLPALLMALPVVRGRRARCA